MAYDEYPAVSSCCVVYPEGFFPPEPNWVQTSGCTFEGGEVIGIKKFSLPLLPYDKLRYGGSSVQVVMSRRKQYVSVRTSVSLLECSVLDGVI